MSTSPLRITALPCCFSIQTRPCASRTTPACTTRVTHCSANRWAPDLDLRSLFHPVAVEVLMELHERLCGKLRYVLTGPWPRALNRSMARTVFNEGGLAFVASNLEGRHAWCTTEACRCQDSSTSAVLGWLEAHYKGEAFAVVCQAPREVQGCVPTELRGRIVLCQPGIGLTTGHVPKLAGALDSKPIALVRASVAS